LARGGGAIDVNCKRGYSVKIVCLSFGERAEPVRLEGDGATLASRKAAARMRPSGRKTVVAEIEFDCGDYPLKLNEAHFDRMSTSTASSVRIGAEHALEDPYNFAHRMPRISRRDPRWWHRRMGHKAGCAEKYSARRCIVLFEPHKPEMWQHYKRNLILKIAEVWKEKYEAFRSSPRKKHLWGYSL